MGSSNENSAYGPVGHPINPDLGPGGSSGGSAAAVAGNMCLASLGSDTGGSIRQPASLCGIIGIKPTYGRISRHGLIAYASSFDQIGPFAHSMEDVAAILEVISGPDNFDSTVSQRPVPDYSAALGVRKKYRIGYIRECIENPGLNPEVKQRTIEILDALRSEGHTVEAVDFPLLDYLVPAYYVLTTAEASSNLARFDGIHYGYRDPESMGIDNTYTRSRTHGFGAEVKRRIMLGTFVLSAGYYDAYYGHTQKVRKLIRENTRKLLTDFDFLATPTTTNVAFGKGQKANDPIAMYLEDIFTVQAPLAGIPGISLPLGKNSEGLPFGFQLMSDVFTEEKLLAFSAELMEKFVSK
jgi:aspartyl-tRNA(Asn)/glutamyl-tRNA(Gln) amidotransferase subunit A